MKNKEIKVTTSQVANIGIDPETVYSIDEGLKSLNEQQVRLDQRGNTG
jgi:hypothetical protein